jgi:hypothetical protein
MDVGDERDQHGHADAEQAETEPDLARTPPSFLPA